MWIFRAIGKENLSRMRLERNILHVISFIDGNDSSSLFCFLSTGVNYLVRFNNFLTLYFSCNIRTLEATSHVSSETYNASRGLAARATSYSRHSNRGNSADFSKTKKDVVVTGTKVSDNFYRNNSGGRARSLHLTSVENPFLGHGVMKKTSPQRKQERSGTQEQLSYFEIFLSRVYGMVKDWSTLLPWSPFALGF